MSPNPSFIEALHSSGPAPDREAKLGLYAFLVGRWELDSVGYGPSGERYTAVGEIHAGWVLEGRGIQDTWIVPARGQPPVAPRTLIPYYGTTLRIYDPNLDAWRIIWSDPLNCVFRRQIARARGKDIVQEGDIDPVDGGTTGAKSRWSFTEITPTSFHWLGERSNDGGATWKLLSENFARRT